MSKLPWSLLLPLEAGWYWWKPNENTLQSLNVAKNYTARLYQVVKESCSTRGGKDFDLWFDTQTQGEFPLRTIAGWWAGPIPIPED
jgi:hypothetical protein